MKPSSARFFSCWHWVAWVSLLWGAHVQAQAPASLASPIQAREHSETRTASALPLPQLVSIASLDVARYMGTWYEIAKFPNRFQRQCVRNTRAHYVAQADGTVQVINRCVTELGEDTRAMGLAKQIGPATSPRLKVRFAPAWLSWLPQVWGDYWVIDLDDDYQLAAVGEPSREYLWVLSRTPTVSDQAYNALLKRLSGQGFEVRKLERSPQP